MAGRDGGLTARNTDRGVSGGLSIAKHRVAFFAAAFGDWNERKNTYLKATVVLKEDQFAVCMLGCRTRTPRAVLNNLYFFFVKDSPQGLPTADRQPPTATNRRKPPTAPSTANDRSIPFLLFCVLPKSCP